MDIPVNVVELQRDPLFTSADVVLQRLAELQLCMRDVFTENVKSPSCKMKTDNISGGIRGMSGGLTSKRISVLCSKGVDPNIELS